jgi:hypothetical protein
MMRHVPAAMVGNRTDHPWNCTEEEIAKPVYAARFTLGRPARQA